MSYHFSPNNSFSKTLPYLQLCWDSTSLGLLKECPRKYFYSIICGFTSRATSVHLTFGLLFHSSLEYYDHMKFSGLDHETALERTLQKVLEDTWDKELKRPIEMDSDNKTRSGLIRTIVWYLDQFQNDPLETVKLANGKPAIELSFQFETSYKSQSTNENFLLCGHLDKVAKMDGRSYIVDRKTTSTTLSSSYFDKYSPDNQFSLYDFAGKVIYANDMSGIIVDAAQVAVTFSRFQRQTIFRTDSVREEWYSDFGEYLFLAERYAEKEYWPMNDKSCNNYGGCPFRSICSKPASIREQFLHGLFNRRTWDPTVARGDI